jgi:hypothetical protein
MPSACNSGFEVEDPAPQSIDLAPLDDFKSFEAVEGIVGSIEPTGDGIRRDNLGQSAVADS